MQNFKLFSFLFFIAFISLQSCGDKCKNCPPNSECVKGVCTCEEGGFMYNSNCAQLDENNYVGVNPDCHCYDTMIVSFSGTGEFRSLTMVIKSGTSIGTLTQGIFYYEQSSGDSIYFPQLDLRCFDDDQTPIKPAIYGKKQPNGNWIFNLEFLDANTLAKVDECNILLKKFE